VFDNSLDHLIYSLSYWLRLEICDSNNILYCSPLYLFNLRDFLQYLFSFHARIFLT